MRKALFNITAVFGMVLALLMAGTMSARAADLALIASGGKTGARPQLTDDLVTAYAEAGYRVIDGRGADRAELIRLIGEFEADATGAGNLVVHLIGPVADSGGLLFYLPRGTAPSSLADVIADGLPLQLFLDLVDRGQGHGMLALGITNFRDQRAERLSPPPDVLLLRGFPRGVNMVVIDQMLRDGRSAGEIDTRSLAVEVDGQANDRFRLTDGGERSPAAREAELNLGPEERLQIQKDLRLLGFEPGAADGIFGRTTREALRDWQAANDQPETAYLTSSQTEDIALGAQAMRDDLRAAATALREEQAAWDRAREEDTPDAYRAYLAAHPEGRFAGAARDSLAEQEEKIAMARRIIAYRETEEALELGPASGAVVEARLERLGYDTGPADGRFDRQTRRALAVFQENRGLEGSGYFDTATLQQLIIAGAEE